MTLAEKTAVVTGASSGIGRAIGLKLAENGARVGLIGRDQQRLEEAAGEARESGSEVVVLPTDLTSEVEIERLANDIKAQFGGLDILIHCAAIFKRGTLESASVVDLDSQIQTNLRAPTLLTQKLLPELVDSQGQVVFMNSSAGVSSGAWVGIYSATKHALRAFADSLRAEVNASGIRVLSVFPGRTATPMQAEIFAAEGRPFEPDRLLQPADVAEMVVAALSLPRTAEVTDIHIRPMQKN